MLAVARQVKQVCKCALPMCVQLLVSHAAQKASWEEQVPGVALGLGAVLVADERPSFAMHWACIQEFWQVLHTLPYDVDTL